MEGAHKRRRSRAEIIADVLRELHYSSKKGEVVTAFLVEKRVGLQGQRVRSLLLDLREMGLIDGDLRLTEPGYTYLGEYAEKVLPFLEKYNLQTKSFQK